MIRAPVFVVTHRPAETIVKRGGTSYIFVTEGIENALLRAREAAGSDDVQVNGGADIARQFFEVGKVDELEIHLVPVLLGGGRRLFDHLGPEHIELERTSIVEGFRRRVAIPQARSPSSTKTRIARSEYRPGHPIRRPQATAGAVRTLPRLPMIVPTATIVNVAPPSIQEHLGYSRTRVAVGCAGSMP
jgi:dihydrofolate reductase